MVIDAQTVKDLRDKTGLPMMKCKAALTETNGDAEKAIELLRKEGLKASDKRSERENNEGLICTLSKNNKQALVELKCETDFVGKNQDFKNFAQDLCEQVIANGAENVAKQKYIRNPAITVEQAIQELTLKIGEKLSIGTVKLDQGLCGAYVHHNGKQAATIRLSGDAKLSENDSVKELLKGICQHIVFTAPKCKSSTDLPADLIEQEKAKFKEESVEELKGKPANIQEKILESKLKKFFSENCLLEQKYIKDDKKSISEVVKNVSKEINSNLSVDDFSLVVVGK